MRRGWPVPGLAPPGEVAGAAGAVEAGSVLGPPGVVLAARPAAAARVSAPAVRQGPPGGGSRTVTSATAATIPLASHVQLPRDGVRGTEPACVRDTERMG